MSAWKHPNDVVQPPFANKNAKKGLKPGFIDLQSDENQ